MKKLFLWIFGILVAACIAVACIWSGEIRSICSVSSVGDNPYLYQMEYKAAYDLDEVISKDLDSNAELLDYVIGRIGKGLPIKIGSSQVADENGELNTFNCTSFHIGKSGAPCYWFGRNYDYFKNPSLVTVSRPKEGYASIAVSDMSHFGYSLDNIPESLGSKLNCLAAIYAPVDGMNEKGLCTSIMALPHQAARQDSGKHKVGTTIIMRLWLDRCATVQEALDLAAGLDICHDAAVGSGYHYMICDASGDSAVLEFDKEDGWKSMVVRKDPGTGSFLVTNHLLSEKYYTDEPDMAVGNVHSKSWYRYETVTKYIEEHGETMTFDQVQECLALVHWKDLVWDTGVVEDTQFSNVYDQDALTLDLRNWNDYDRTVHFSLAR